MKKIKSIVKCLIDIGGFVDLKCPDDQLINAMFKR
jgi:hypothetical protein